MKHSTIIKISSAVFAIAAIAGCRTNAVFKQKAEDSTTAIQAAQGEGAGSNATSDFYLRQAQESMDKAKELFSKGKKKQATSLLNRAEADAALAKAVAAQDKEKTDAADAMARLKQLKTDNPMDDSDTSNEGDME
ncbi:MAG: DUF4398 domain-containing protein [Myxococcota bacterium]